MPATYGVTIADVSGEIPSLVPNGFTGTSKPTDAKVLGWIAAADAIATLAVFKTSAVTPQVTDASAAIARQFIIAWTLAWVMRATFAGNDPKDVAAAAAQYADPAAALLEQLEALGAQAAGTGVVAASLIRGSDGSTARDMLVTDEDLGGLLDAYPSVRRARRF